ncbi:MAG: hypothetical protein Fur0022_38610 [Anaerolineales bacterium]
MRKVIFLSGVSGAGKTTVGKALIKKSVSVVELDQLVRVFYPLLNVGNDTTNPYRFDDWEKFLTINHDNTELLNTFQNYMLSPHIAEDVNLFLIGNHFLLPCFEQTLINTLTPIGFQPAIKLLLDRDWKIVYLFRKRRGTPRDRQVSMKEVRLQTRQYREILWPRGYISVNKKQLHAIVDSYFQIK